MYGCSGKNTVRGKWVLAFWVLSWTADARSPYYHIPKNRQERRFEKIADAQEFIYACHKDLIILCSNWKLIEVKAKKIDN